MYVFINNSEIKMKFYKVFPFLLVMILSVFSWAGADERDEQLIEPTSLFRATTHEGKRVYVLGTCHTRLITQDPPALKKTLEDLAETDRFRFVKESSDEKEEQDQSAASGIFDRTFVEIAKDKRGDLRPQLVESFGSEEALAEVEARFERLKEKEESLFEVFKHFGHYDDVRNQFHPLACIYALYMARMVKKGWEGDMPEDSASLLMDGFVERLFVTSGECPLILETDAELYGGVFHDTLLTSKKLLLGLLESLEGQGIDELDHQQNDKTEKEFQAQKMAPRSTTYIQEEGDWVDFWFNNARQFRNRVWEEKLKLYLEDWPASTGLFIAVGMNHLADESGVFRMLERYGITSDGIEQLLSDGTWRVI